MLFVNGKIHLNFYRGYEWKNASLFREDGSLMVKFKAYRLSKFVSQFSNTAGMI